MYGYKDVYFNKNHDGFRNAVWIELIGFDNEAADYGVADYLSKTGFVPDVISFHLTSISFMLTHKGMEKEHRLPTYACSYVGHAGNDDRHRQEWTNYQLRGLIDELHSSGIKVYVSMFDFDYDPKLPEYSIFGEEHPELRTVTNKNETLKLLHMLNSFDDGTTLADFFIKKLREVIRDYSLDGVQVADGVSSPRVSLQKGDYSHQTTSRFFKEYGITPPENCIDVCSRAEYIFKNHRPEWIAFYRRHWSEFMAKVIEGIHAEGAKADFNSAWTRGPIEAIYRYGTDYKAYERAGADAFVVEDVAGDLFFLSNRDNGFDMPHERRKFVHYEFESIMLQLRAWLPKLMLTPLAPIRDTLEQWDVIHHMPASMQRSVSVNLNNYYIDETGRFVPTVNGPHFCLGDGLKAHEWDYIRMMWDNAYTEKVEDVLGVTVVWSDKVCEKELDLLISGRYWYSGKWMSELLCRGGAVHKITRIENLGAVKGPILVINPMLFDEDEKAMIDDYRGGEVLTLGLANENTVEFSAMPDKKLTVEPLYDVVDPYDAIWTNSLIFTEIDPDFVTEVAAYINNMCALPTLTEDFGACHINEVKTSENTSRIFIDNEEYWYALPTVHLKRKIKDISFVTKPECYPIKRPDDYSFIIRIPGFGMDIVEVTYED